MSVSSRISNLASILQPFHFKQFSVWHGPGLKVTTEACVLGAWSQLPGQRLADLGTGTGLLAFMLAQRYPKAHLMTIERDPEMADIARKNVAESPFAERIQVVGQDVHEFAQQHPASFDGLIVNPPSNCR